MTNSFKKRKRDRVNRKQSANDSSDTKENEFEDMQHSRKLRHKHRRHHNENNSSLLRSPIEKEKRLKPQISISDGAFSSRLSEFERMNESVPAQEVEYQESDESHVEERTGPEGAAFQSRLPCNKMSLLESQCFPEITKDCKDTIVLFVTIRNKILEMWFDNPMVELELEKMMIQLRNTFISEISDGDLILRIYHYLNRHGLINFGVYTPSLQSIANVHQVKHCGNIIVIGAGMAGLGCARQLQSFGFNVTVIEARGRVGGRIATFRKGNYIADLGAMVVTGLGGNPTSTLSKQVNMELFKIKQRCPLFQNNGKLVSIARDDVTEIEFNRLLEATSYLSHSMNFNFVDGKPITLGQALELIINLQEKHTKMKLCEYQRNTIEIHEKLTKCIHEFHINKIVEIQNKLVQVNKEWEAVDAYPEPRVTHIEFKVRHKQREMRTLLKQVDDLQMQRTELEKNLKDLTDQPPCDVYLSTTDRHIMDWHFANLEFANATPLYTLSLRHWDQDDDYEFSGNHLYVKNGFSAIPIALSQGVNIKLNKAVRKIEINSSGCKITTTDSKLNDNQEVFTADAVVVTLPLGVLKDSLRSSVSDPRNVQEKVSNGIGNGIQFCPPLPEWKTDAISRMGFGCLNKVVLCFDKVFWDPNCNLFGHISQTTQSRGELFLFWNLYKAPVLLALIAGHAAGVMETINDDICVCRTLAVLKGIFGSNKVPQPRESVVTRWRTDVFSRGSYSYVAAGSTGNDYDLLATPVNLDRQPGKNGYGDSGNHHNPGTRLFFAGEHTIRNYPATVHGAYLSGLREAARISNLLIGIPYTDERSKNLKERKSN